MTSLLIPNATPAIEDRRLRPILDKVESRERLSFEDGVTMFRSQDILALGYMANLQRERAHGDVTYFNVNRHINPTDVCVASCRLCAFGKRAKDPKAYTMSLEQVWETAGQGWSEAVTEFHIVGGLHPELTLDWYCEMLRGLKDRFPQVHLKAFTMVEVGYFARHHKIDGGEWIEVARQAHRMGLKSNCTMLYGHLETEEDRVDHLVKLRALQDETHGFQTFIPLAFHPANTALEHLSTTTGFDDLKNIAVSRLMLDNVPHIKAYWIMMTPKIAQVAQRFGSDDLDGTVVEEKIYHDAGATTTQSLRRNELLALIRKAGREPLERDT